MAVVPRGLELILFARAWRAFDSLAATLRAANQSDENIMVDGHLAPYGAHLRPEPADRSMVDHAVGVLSRHGYTSTQAQDLVFWDAVETRQTLVQAAEGLLTAHSPSPGRPG